MTRRGFVFGGLTLFLFQAAHVSAAAPPISVFQIGNSLTWDSQPGVISSMAATIGVNWTAGYHVRSASSLSDIWNNPTPAENSVPGPTYVEGLRDSDWTALVMQPYRKSGNTLGLDLQYMKQFIDASQAAGRNIDSRYYIYTSWPLSYQWDAWLNPVGDSLTQLTLHQRQYFQNLAERISDDIDRDVYSIPVGDVLYRVREEWAAGRLPELGSFSSVYRDSIHLSLSTGRFIAETTVLATILGTDPADVVTDYSVANPILSQRLKSIIWDVVANHPFSGVVAPRLGDVNGDGDVDNLDLAILQNDFINQPLLRADVNGDLRVDELDLTYWELSLQPTQDEIVANFNGDQAVDQLDYDLWVADYGKSGEMITDANDDGAVNGADYTIWRNAISSHQARMKADFNDDGSIDLLDREAWEEENGLYWELRADFSGNNVLDLDDFLVWQENYYDFSARLVGDYDQNGIVDPADLTVWAQTFGSRFMLNADGNADGQVNAADYSVWRNYYNQAGGNAAAVPEPAAWSLAAIALVGLGLRWRREIPDSISGRS